jgi:LuxR family transcriptional regulator, maltose regulon positive regulatory protein
MSASDAGPRDGRPPGPDLLAAKLRPPVARPGTVARPLLVERLEQGDGRPIVLLVAPAGYGKTTLLSQWSERGGPAFAWVSVDPADNDPKELLTYVAVALDAVERIDGGVFDALGSPANSVPGSALPRLGTALSSMRTPFVLVLDDVETLHDRECQDALSVLADHVPAGSRLVLAGRAEPPLRVPRLRAEGKILEIGPADLSLSRVEAAALLRSAGLEVSDGDVAELHRRTEGWPAGLYLAALALRAGGPLGSAAISFRGDDRLVTDYLEAEFLSRISQQERVFLTRTAALERMSGPLCDAVLGEGGSAAVLAGLERSNQLLVPLDRRRGWYRYHHLFRDMLLAELGRLEPSLVPVLQRRAAEWYEGQGAPGTAIRYWMAAGDVAAVARLVGLVGFDTYQRGRAATVEHWIGWLEDHAGLADHPDVAVLAAALAAMTGQPANAERWAKLAELESGVASLPDGSPSIEPWRALLRALLCPAGPDQMRADAEFAARSIAPRSFWRTAPVLCSGVAHLMAGDPGRASALFEDAVAEGRASGGTLGACLALAERSLLAMADGQWELGAWQLSEAQAMTRAANLGDYPPIAILYAAAAQMALHEDDRPRAAAELTRAQRLRPALTYALPHFAVQARVELARGYLALGDLAGARALMQEADEVLVRRPHLGLFAQQAGDLRAELARAGGSAAVGASALTTAELRLLPMLCTHLSFREIAEELFLSLHTVKSQANSIYRKLAVSSRSQAVARARQAGLLEG